MGQAGAPTNLQMQAIAEMERRRRHRRGIGLGEFVAQVAPKNTPYEAPNHLSPVVQMLEAAEYQAVRGLSSVPPRHGKTETILHNIAQRLLRRPQTRIAYVTYALAIAVEKSRRAQEIAVRAGVELARGQSAFSHWATNEGGCLFATGIDGQLTSLGFELIVVDDPHKNRAEAESSVYRQKVYDWFTSTVLTRVEPGGSVIVNHTRWHPDDLIGRLATKGRWQYENLPAIADDGQALWPSRWPLHMLEERRAEIGEYDWNSLYLGRPRVRGGTVFHDVRFYDAAPSGMRIAIGVDLAYTAKTSSDYSVAVVVGELNGLFHVLHVVRRQCAAPTFAAELQGLQRTYPGAPMHAYVGGTEQGTVDFLITDYDLPIHVKAATKDKFQRSQKTAAKWNSGKVLVPKDGPEWTSPFVSELLDFTGVSDTNDDQVDALASGVDALADELQFEWEPLSGGSRRW